MSETQRLEHIEKWMTRTNEEIENIVKMLGDQDKKATEHFEAISRAGHQINKLSARILKLEKN